MDTCECKICGSDKALTGTKLCNQCWEVTSRLDYHWLKNPQAVLFVCKELAEADERFACLRNLQADEPIFILKAKDQLASHIVQIWAMAARQLSVPMDKCNHALKVVEDMIQWGKKYGTKVPD
jgi:hypothetical protein